jgi:hypothetical protein
MEGNLPSSSMIPGGSAYGTLDLQSPIRAHHHNHRQQSTLSLQQQLHHSHQRQPPVSHSSIQENFPLTIGTMQETEPSITPLDYTKVNHDRGRSSDDDDLTFADNRGKKVSPWHRVKWTDAMVRILITAVSYIGEESESGSRRKHSNLQKRGKWKSVSQVMAERSHFVSPQQCEDKFNDLNKRYKRLNEILGRGTSCEVVENPTLLDVMEISEKSKDEVRKILSSKHLYYEEMCSYHNGNRLHLPPDPDLQHSLRLALRNPHDDHDDDQDAETDGQEDFEENRMTMMKKMKHCHPQNVSGTNLALNDEMKAGLLKKQWMKQRWLQLEDQKLQIKGQMLELEKEKYKWERFCKKKDKQVEIMRMENERMKLENEHMEIELKRKEIVIDNC